MMRGAFLGFSLLLLAAEQSSRFCVTLLYFLTGRLLWGSVTVALLLPSYLAQGLSLLWFQADGHRSSRSLVLIHLLQLGIWKRYWDTRLSVLKAQGALEMRELTMQQGDLAILRLLEALLQTLPSLLLQAYSCVMMEAQGVVSGLSAGLSLLSFCWALVSYSHFTHLIRPGHLSMPGAALFCQLLWRMGMVGSRVVTLVLFARVYHLWVFVVTGAHWLVMSYWVVAQQTDIFRNPCRWRVFSFLMGAVYVFCYISFKDGPSHYRVTVYYTVMSLENILLLLMAGDFLKGDLWSTLTVIGAVMSGFVMGSAALVTYYSWLHPKSTENWQDFLKRSGSVGPVGSKGTGGFTCQSANQTARSAGISDWQNTEVLSAESATPSLGMSHNSSLVELGSCRDVSDPWENHHHWLLVKLALKTGDVSKINSAFGEGGIGELYTIAVMKRENSINKLGHRKKVIFSTSPKAVRQNCLPEENKPANRLSSPEEGSSVALPASKPIAAKNYLRKHSPIINSDPEDPPVGTDLNGIRECYSGGWRDTVGQEEHSKRQGEQQIPLCTDSTVYFTASIEAGFSKDKGHKMIASLFADPEKNNRSGSVQDGQLDKEGFPLSAANASHVSADTNARLQSSSVCCFPSSFNTSTSPELADQQGMLRLSYNLSDISLSGNWVAVLKGNGGSMEEPRLTSTPKKVTTSPGYAS